MPRKPDNTEGRDGAAPRRPLAGRVAGIVADSAGALASAAGTTLADVVNVGLGIIDRAPKRGRYDRSVPTNERKKATRNRLLQAAAKVFTQKGYADTSVADIIAEAGTSRQTYYDEFPNKEAALIALQEQSVRFMIPFIRRAMDGESTVEKKVEAGVTALLRLVEQAGPLAEVALREMGHTPAAMTERERMRKLFCDLLIERADEAHRQGLTERSPDLVTIKALVGGIESVALDYLRAGRGKYIMEARPQLVRLLLRSLT